MTFWTPSGFRMLSKLLRPNSDAEEMTRVPPPTILSRIPCSKRTSLMASSGISIDRSEEHTSELQSRVDLVCRLLLEKKKKSHKESSTYTKTERTQEYCTS